MFEIESGKIRRMEAMLERAAHGMGSGWSTSDDAMSERARDITGVN
jgi:hypothetical protein